MTTLHTITCPECRGDGGWDADEHEYGWRKCNHCAGNGSYEIELPDVTDPPKCKHSREYDEACEPCDQAAEEYLQSLKDNGQFGVGA